MRFPTATYDEDKSLNQGVYETKKRQKQITGMPVSPTQKTWDWWEKPEKACKFEPKQWKMG